MFLSLARRRIRKLFHYSIIIEKKSARALGKKRISLGQENSIFKAELLSLNSTINRDFKLPRRFPGSLPEILNTYICEWHALIRLTDA